MQISGMNYGYNKVVSSFNNNRPNRLLFGETGWDGDSNTGTAFVKKKDVRSEDDARRAAVAKAKTKGMKDPEIVNFDQVGEGWAVQLAPRGTHHVLGN
jgi:hypothetical protein